MAEVMHLIVPKKNYAGQVFTECGIKLWDPAEPITRDTTKVRSTNVLASVTCEACKASVVTENLTVR